MALADTAELVAEMNLRGDFPRNAVKMQKGLDGLNKRTKELRGGLSKIGQGLAKGFKSAAVIGAGAAGFLAFQVFQGVESLAELEDVTNATARAIKSTGGVAKVTAKDVRGLAEEYEDLTTVDDKVIQGAANLLLTFTNVRKKAFEPTLAVALDMAEALDMDLNSAVRSLGKALNDPATGLTRLTRLGVTFTEQEQRKIQTLQKSGRTLEAQQVILGKLNRLYGGRAQTAASGYRGSLNRLNDSVEELQQSLAGPLIRPLTRVANKLARFAKTEDIQEGLRGIGQAFANLFETPVDTQATGVQDAFGKGLTAALTPSAFEQGLSLIKEAFNTVKTLPWETIRGGLQKTFEVAAKAVDLFKGLPPELQTALITLLAANKLTGGLVASGLKDIAGLALSSLRTITAANVTVIGKSVTGPGTPTVPGTTPGVKTPGVKTPGPVAVPLIGAGIFGTLEDIEASAREVRERFRVSVEEQRRQTALQQGESVTSKTGNAILSNVKGFAAQANEYARLQARLAPISNDLLDGIAADAQAQANSGKTMTMLGRLQANKIAGLVPVLGGVKQAVTGVTSAVNRNTSATLRQDLSVRVSVAATTVVEGVNRVTNQNRFVVD